MRHRARLSVLVAAATSLAACVAGAASSDASQMLFVTYNGTTPTVTLASGAAVGTPNVPGTLIPAGTYTVQIAVSSEPADFQIVGPGVNFLDNEPSTEVYTLTFAASSTYAFEDVTNPGGTLGYFSTTATISTGTPQSAPLKSKTKEANSDIVGSQAPAAKKPQRLEATVTPAGAISLVESARKVTRLEVARYTVVVADKSRRAGFTLQKRGQRAIAITGMGFTGRQSFTLTLSAGTWFFYASPSHKAAFTVKG